MPKKLTLLSFAKKRKEAKKEPDRNVIRFLKRLKKGSVLILPAGTGLEADHAQKAGFSVTSIDDDLELIKKARARNSRVDFNYSTFFAFARRLKKNQFDYVVDNGMSHTLRRKQLIKFYKIISKTLRHNGKLMTKALSTADAHCKKHCPLRQWTYDDGRYVNFFNKGFLVGLLKKSGFRIDSYSYVRTDHAYHVVISSLKLMKL